MTAFKALLLDDQDVLVDVVTLTDESQLTARHVDLRPHGGDCDNPPGQYRWDRERATLVALGSLARPIAPGVKVSAEQALFRLIELLELKHGLKVDDVLMQYQCGYRLSLDGGKAGRA